jgi:hypothetical protein
MRKIPYLRFGAVLLTAILALSLGGCGSRIKSGSTDVTGIGFPDPRTEAQQKRLEAYSKARDDAWRQLYDEVRAMPLSGGELVGDRLLSDPWVKAKVISHIWNSKVIDQDYNPETETATVRMRCDLTKVYDLL